MSLDPERIRCLKALIAAYQQEHDFDSDNNVESTYEMIAQVKYLLLDLEGGKSESVPDTLPW